MQEESQTGALNNPDQNNNNEPRANNVRGLGVNQNLAIKKLSGFLYVLAFSMFFFDVVAKRSVVLFEPSITYGFFEFSIFRNTGMIFSLPAPEWLYLPISISVFLLFALSLILSLQRKEQTSIGLLFIVLGAISNITDRIIHNATIDYFIFFERSAINIADVMIIVGVILFIMSRKQGDESDQTSSITTAS